MRTIRRAASLRKQLNLLHLTRIFELCAAIRTPDLDLSGGEGEWKGRRMRGRELIRREMMDCLYDAYVPPERGVGDGGDWRGKRLRDD